MSLDVASSQKSNSFSFSSEMEEIAKSNQVKAKDRELAKRFQKYVNPSGIPDGHCASCAFNTHLHFVGHEISEAVSPDDYKKFGDWFYYKFAPRFEDHVLEPKENETFGAFKDRVAKKVKELTKPFEAVLISISDGAHWLNAYNDGKRIWFIDSQTGRPFNLYENENRKKNEVITCSAVVNIITVSLEDVSEYNKKFSAEVLVY